MLLKWGIFNDNSSFLVTAAALLDEIGGLLVSLVGFA